MCPELPIIEICLRRGDNYGGRTFTITDGDGLPIPIVSAHCQARDLRGRLVHDFAPTVSGGSFNVVTLSPIDEAISQALPEGIFTADLQLNRGDGIVRTYLLIKVVIKKDISIP